MEIGESLSASFCRWKMVQCYVECSYVNFTMGETGVNSSISLVRYITITEQNTVLVLNISKPQVTFWISLQCFGFCLKTVICEGHCVFYVVVFCLFLCWDGKETMCNVTKCEFTEISALIYESSTSNDLRDLKRPAYIKMMCSELFDSNIPIKKVYIRYDENWIYYSNHYLLKNVNIKKCWCLCNTGQRKSTLMPSSAPLLMKQPKIMTLRNLTWL